MATVNALSVALFNAAAGGYAAEMTANAAGFANAVGPILEKDVSTDALFVDHLLGNLGVTSTNAVYAQAKAAVAALVTTKGRAGAATDAVDFLKAQEGSTSAYATIAANFAAKVNAAAAFTAANATERDITKLISGVTGVDTDAAAIAAAAAAVEAAAATAAAAAAAKAAADLAAANAAAEAAATAAAAALAAAEAEAAADLAAANAAAEAAATKAAADLAAANAAAEASAAKAAADLATANATITALQNPTGGSFALTSASDTKIGVGRADAFTATSTTYTAGDIIVDAGVDDADTLTVTATGDISATPFVVGIETVNFALSTVDAGGDATFTIEADNIATSGISVSATKVGNIITTADVNDVKSGVTVTSGLATIDVSTVANADVAIVGTRAAGTSVVQTGTADTIAVTTTGALTATAGNNAFTAEESVTLVSGGAVTLDDATANAASTDVDYTITAAGAITVTRIADTGSLVANTTTGNITITRADSDGDVTLSTGRGNVTVTNADAAEGTLTVTATGDNDSNVSGADGTITVTSADGTTSAVLTASAGITVTSMAAALEATLSAGAASTLADIDALADLTIQSTSTSSTAVTFTVSAGQGAALETITATGSKGLTFVMGGDDMVAAVTATGENFTFVDNTTGGTTTLKIDDDTGAALNLTGVGFDRIELAADNGTSALTLSSGANLLVSLSQTDLTLTTAASAGRSVNITLDHATTGTGVTLTDLSTTNFATVNLALGDATADYVLTDISVTASTDLVVTGGGDLAVTDYTSLKSFNASAVTGAVTFSAVANNKQITTGSGADSFTINDADTTTLNIDGGSGIDTVVFTASDDYSSGTLNFSNIEKLSVVNSSITLAASQLNGSSYIIYADGADTLAVNVMSAVGETVNLSDVTASQAVITVTGNDGVDVITAPSTYGITINAGSGNDNITGGGGNDTISGEGGSDTINISSGGTDTIHLAASGKDTIIGFGTTDVINVEALSGGDTDFESAVVKGAASAVTSKTAYILSTDGTAANLTTSGTATVSDFTNLTQVAAYLEERFNVADNDVAAFIVNVGTTTYVYDMNDADDTTIGSTDLTLVGVITQAAALTVSNVSFTA